jgi:hypothetical protein
MPLEEQDDRWLTPMLAEFLPVAGEVLRILDDEVNPADRWMLIRRAVEYDLRAGAEGISEQLYRQAAAALRGLGQEEEASAMDSLAEASEELEEASRAWRNRYAGRAMSAAEQEALALLASGRVLPDETDTIVGIDGALCTPATLMRPDGAAGRTVIVTGNAGRSEIVTGFEDEPGLTAWLADRGRGRETAAEGLEAARPVAGCVTGPVGVTRHEERLLAWLLQDESVTRTGVPALPPGVFTTHSRDEIYQAWHTAAEAAGTAPEAGQVRQELARRMLRAPSWAASLVGWPFGQVCLAYFDRLTTTPVTRTQGEEAARELARAVARPASQRIRQGSGLVRDLAPGGDLGRAAGLVTGPPVPRPSDGPLPGRVPRM